ncbi:MAG: chemotaxis protein CheA [Gemmatimonadaceae bacterium]
MSSRYADLYLTESRDHLTAANAALLELERSPRASEPLDALFRAVHTLKGMSGVMGYAAVGELSHEMETLLAAIRGGERALDPDALALLFDAADALERAVGVSVGGDEAAVDTTAVVARLRAAGVDDVVVVPFALDLKRPRLPDAIEADATDLQVRLASDAPLPGARALLILQRARTLGEIVAVSPDESSFLFPAFDGEFAFRMVTSAADADLERTIRGSGYVDRISVRRRTASLAAADSVGGGGERRGDAWDTDRANAALQRFVRIDLRRLDAMMNLTGELVIARGRLAQLAAEHRDSVLDDTIDHASRLIGELQTNILASRMVPVWQIFDRFPRVVRDAARDVGKLIDFEILGREIELDRSLLEQVGDPLVHLLRNAIDHGLEGPEEREAAGKPRVGRLTLSTTRESAAVVIRVTEDGRGVDRDAVLRRAKVLGFVDVERESLSDDELLRMIARPGFSTAERVTSLSGRGVGIDAVVTRVRALGGALELKTVRGEGTSILLRLPVTMAIIPALLARVGSETYALPLTHIRETLQLTEHVRRAVRGRDVLVLRDEVLTLRHLRAVVGLPARDEPGGQVVVLEAAERRTGLVVDQLLGQQEIVVKPFDAVRGAVQCFSGATILADGLPALIVEVSNLI